MIDDETLFAFVDGELDPDEMERVAALVAADPALTRRVERQHLLLAEARAQHEAVLSAPLPDAWIAAIDAASIAPAGSPVASLAAARDRRRAPMAMRIGGAIAASLAIGLGLGATLLAPRPGLVTERDGQIVLASQVAHAFDTARSGEPVAIGPAGTMVVKLSLRDGAGRYCREGEIAGGDGQNLLACRSKGGWTVAALAKSAPQSQDAYREASGDDPLDAAIDALGAAPLDGDAEKKAIEAGWR